MTPASDLRCTTHHPACKCQEAKVEELVRRAGKIANSVLKNTVASAHHYEARMVRAAIKALDKKKGKG